MKIKSKVKSLLALLLAFLMIISGILYIIAVLK